MGSWTREQVYAALVEGWHRCPETAPSTLDGMTDAVMALLAAHDQDHRVLCEVETKGSPGHRTSSFLPSDTPLLPVPPGTVVAVVTRPDTAP